MPLVFAAISPHPPILIPSIGKDHLKKIKKTQEALKKLEQDLYVAKPDSILVISPHGKILEDAFGINLSAEYQGGFKEFGDFSTKLEFKGDYLSIQEIRAADETQKEVPIILTSEPEVDHGVSIPLYYLIQHLKDVKIIPVSHSLLDYQTHFKFGQFLARALARINKRFAVIASADLSHCLTKEAPAGYSAKGKIFDEKIIELLKKKDTKGILNLDKKLIEAAKECGLRPIIILLGILENVNCQPEVLSYEGPFGVGYAVVNFKLS